MKKTFTLMTFLKTAWIAMALSCGFHTTANADTETYGNVISISGKSEKGDYSESFNSMGCRFCVVSHEPQAGMKSRYYNVFVEQYDVWNDECPKYENGLRWYDKLESDGAPVTDKQTYYVAGVQPCYVTKFMILSEGDTNITLSEIYY